LTSWIGDADLFMSFTNPNPGPKDHDLSSRRSQKLDQIEIDDTSRIGTFNRTIYISVYGKSEA